MECGRRRRRKKRKRGQQQIWSGGGGKKCSPVLFAKLGEGRSERKCKSCFFFLRRLLSIFMASSSSSSSSFSAAAAVPISIRAYNSPLHFGSCKRNQTQFCTIFENRGKKNFILDGKCNVRRRRTSSDGDCGELLDR